MSLKGNPGFVKKTIRTALALSIFIVIVIMFLSDSIVTIVGGLDMKDAAHYLVLMSLSIIFRAVGPIISTSILVVNGLSKALSKSFIWDFLIYSLGMLLLYYLIGFSITNIILVYLVSLSAKILYRIFAAKRNGLVHWLK